VPIPFIDLQSQYREHKESIDQAVLKVLGHGQYIMGPEITELELQLAEYVGAKYALACSSGTDALILPLMTKNLSETDAIFTSPFTFFASAESITLSGATPVFVDIDPSTYNLDANALESAIDAVKKKGKLTPRGIVPVDLFGLAADYNRINRIAQQHDLFVLEDAAQSFAAKYHGARAGSLGDVAATSFYPAKPLGCYGDGGAVFTNDTAMFEEMVSLRVHGQGKTGDKYDNIRIGLNARMDTIQAAVLLEKLKYYEHEVRLRNNVANAYSERLKEYAKIPSVPNNQESVWAQYSIQIENRDEVREALSKEEIPTAVFYPIPIHLSTAYQKLNHKVGDFPNSEYASDRILSLPMHPYLSEQQIEFISNIIIKQAKR